MGITGKRRSSLARGVALLLVGGLAAGCSTANFADGVTTNSVGSVGSAQANQPYPGDVHIIRPKADVGGGILQPSAPASTLPPPSSTVYTAPAASSGVSAAPLPPPSGTQRSALA